MLEVVRQVTEANRHGAKRKNTIMFISFDAKELRKKTTESLILQRVFANKYL